MSEALTVTYVRHTALLSCVTPPPGTDVRAVQGPSDHAPILLGTLLVFGNAAGDRGNCRLLRFTVLP
jgi:hypothetical protein